MTHLLPSPSEVAVGVTEDHVDHQLRQRMARLRGQRLPLRRLRRGGGRVAEQIELTCIAVRMAVSGRRAHGHLPASRRESPMLRLNPQLRWWARNRRHILPQRCQGGEDRNVNIGSGANTPCRASRPIKHPGRNLQPSRRSPTREAATENLSASLLNHLMNMDQASGPRMPRIKKLVLRDPVGVPSTCCITAGVSIRVLTAPRWIKLHPAATPHGSLNPGRAPPIDAKILFRQTGPAQTSLVRVRFQDRSW